MRLLVVNADDFGLSEGVNAGIIEAHTDGIVTSASLMVGRPGAEQAAALARRHPRLSVGLHFAPPDSVDLDDPAQAGAELCRQVERFGELIGAFPTHVDSHHHVHAEGERLSTFDELLRPLGVALRHAGQVAYIGGFYAQWEEGVTDLDHVRRPFLLELIDTEVLDGVTELACHPARITGDFSSSYLEEREVELRTLTERGLREEIESRGVQLVGHGDRRG
jgi:chitin disaccharide deacetylase